MSRKRINASILKALKEPLKGGSKASAIRAKVGTKAYTHSITVNVKIMASGYKEALKAVQSPGYQESIRGFNYLNNWEPIIKGVILGFAFLGQAGGSLGTGWKKGIGKIPKGLAKDRLRIRKKNNNEFIFDIDSESKGYQTQLNDLLKAFRETCYVQWLEQNGILEDVRTAEGQRTIYKDYTGKIGRTVGTEAKMRMGAGDKKKQGTSFRHSKQSTTATARIAQILEKEFRNNIRYPGLDYDYVVYDLLEAIFDLLEIKWEEEPFYNAKTGQMEMTRVVRGYIDPKHIDEATDKKGIRSKTTPGSIDEILEIINSGIKTMSGFVDKKTAAKFEASPSFLEQATAGAQYKLIRDLMLKNKKYKPLVKIKTVPPKAKKRRDTAKKSKLYRPQVKRGRASKSINTPVSQGKESGEGREASTSVAAELARLRKYIQSRLPAEVRRNMGRPALQNRTGRFSNSVQLMSLTQAQNTIMAKYTYLLSPYQTFENTGRRRWPMAYNPKPIIAKSIRNLALGRIEQKLTVRRV